MRRIQNSPLLLTCLALCAVISVAYAATPELGTKSNSYYLYTQALNTTALTAQMDLATAEKLGSARNEVRGLESVIIR